MLHNVYLVHHPQKFHCFYITILSSQRHVYSNLFFPLPNPSAHRTLRPVISMLDRFLPKFNSELLLKRIPYGLWTNLRRVLGLESMLLMDQDLVSSSNDESIPSHVFGSEAIDVLYHVPRHYCYSSASSPTHAVPAELGQVRLSTEIERERERDGAFNMKSPLVHIIERHLVPPT